MSINSKVSRLALEHITEDPKLQGRELKRAVVGRYVEALRRNEVLPPVTIVRDKDDNYYLVDGYHRLAATRELNGVDTIDAEIVPGTYDGALWYSWGANRYHGLQRTHEGLRSAVRAALTHPKWSKESDRKIGRQIGCDHKTVGNMRRTLERGRGEFPTGRRKAVPSKGKILKACQLLASAPPEKIPPFDKSEYPILQAGCASLLELLSLAESSNNLASAPVQ